MDTAADNLSTLAAVNASSAAVAVYRGHSTGPVPREDSREKNGPVEFKLEDSLLVVAVYTTTQRSCEVR